MLVKKVNPEWKPSENKDLKVGDTIDMSDPKALILGGDAVAIDEATGAEISAFELYGVIVDREFEEFKAYQQMKSQERQAARLKAEAKELKKQLEEAKSEKSEEVKEEVPAQPKAKVDATMKWGEMMKLGKELGVFSVGMKKQELIDAINNA